MTTHISALRDLRLGVEMDRHNLPDGDAKLAALDAAIAVMEGRDGEQAVRDAAFGWAVRETYQMVDPLNPPPAGSYARGEHEGIIAALKTVRENFIRALKSTNGGDAK